jgi:hypothetical protein
MKIAVAHQQIANVFQSILVVPDCEFDAVAYIFVMISFEFIFPWVFFSPHIAEDARLLCGRVINCDIEWHLTIDIQVRKERCERPRILVPIEQF